MSDDLEKVNITFKSGTTVTIRMHSNHFHDIRKGMHKDITLNTEYFAVDVSEIVLIELLE